MTFLALDVGNTRLKWAQYESIKPGAKLLGQGAVFLENIDRLGDDVWSTLTTPTQMLGCIVAGEAIRRRVEEQLELWVLEPQWIVPSQSEAGLTSGYDHPSRLGADRWVAMIGALAMHRSRQLGAQQRPLVVVMVGTAVTVDAIDASGHFMGGFILPGHGIMLRALESGTAGLHVPTGDVKQFPTNTSDALTSGGTFAIAGAIEQMVQHLRARTGFEPLCLMTGGAGWKMEPYLTTPFELIESLIFDGILHTANYRFNKKN
jgi:type III pantothenate kinase